jgi:hypothetical protein
MKFSQVLLLAFLFAISINSTNGQIKVANNKRDLQTIDNQPFFWLADTNWEMFHRLNRDEIRLLIQTRKSQGFNILQAVALAEFNGIREANRYGDYPLVNEDPANLSITPGKDTLSDYEYDYWDHVDFAIEEAAKHEMYIGLLPTWGDKVTPSWGDGPVIFDSLNAKTYGSILAKRYAAQKNIIWILGGDRPAIYERMTNGINQAFNQVAIWRAMADGIETVLGKEAFITYHPSGGSYRSSHYVHQEPWLDMNAFQSGHGSRESEPWKWVLEDLALTPTKPTLDMEPCYEDHPVNPWDGKWTKQRGYFTAYDVRARVYRGIFAGACGVTYGHHQIWQFVNPDLYPTINLGDTLIGWKKAMLSEAATQMKHLKYLLLSRPFFNRKVDSTLIISSSGIDYTDKIISCVDSIRSFALIYLPENKDVRIDLTQINGKEKNIWWYDVRTGTASHAFKKIRKTKLLLTPPKSGKDWVLVIDDASKGYGTPGLVQ